MPLCGLLVSVLVWGLVLAVVWWAISKVPVPEPFSWVVQVVFALIVILVLFDLLRGGGNVAIAASVCRGI